MAETEVAEVTKGTPPTKIKWEEAGTRFITGEDRPSIAAIAEEFGVSDPTAYKWAHRLNWWRKREDYWDEIRRSVESEIQERAAQSRVKRINALSRVIDRKIAALASQKKLDDVTISDLIRLMETESQIVREGGGKDRTTAQELEDATFQILGVQVERVRAIVGVKKDHAFDANQQAALRRLHILEGDSRETAGDGAGPA